MCTRSALFEHPGEGRRRGRGDSPRGGRSIRRPRTRSPHLLGDRPRRRDLLIEHLHLDPGRLQADLRRPSRRARRRDAALVRRSVRDRDLLRPFRRGEGGRARASPPLTIRVCDSPVLRMLAAAEACSQELQAQAGPGVRVVRAPCVGRCDTAPVAEVGHQFRRPRQRRQRARGRQRRRHARAYPRLCRLSTPMSPTAAIGCWSACAPARLSQRRGARRRSTRRRLRGLGGAGFPTGRKWRSVRGEPGPRLMASTATRASPARSRTAYYLETRSASLPRRHADRRACGRGDRHLHLHPRRISGRARNPANARSRSCRRAARCCICGAAPAPISAARNPR